MKTRTYLAPASLILLAASLACANTRGAETGGGGGDGGGGGEEVATPTPLPAGATLSASGLEGQLYIGTFEPPEEGYAAFFVHDDFALDMLAVHTGRITWSVYMTGTLEGQRVDLDEENGRARVSGRPGGPGFEINISIPGEGFELGRVAPTQDAGLYRGELNDLIAGLMVLSDGSVYGIAAVEGGEEPVYEYLCVEGGVEGLPEEITATTCDTGVEVTLTKLH